MTPAIKVENLSKRYRINKRMASGNGRLSLLKRAADPFRYLASNLRSPDEDEILWALKEISFEVQQGEVLGIIGRNGAGKSTLLKILSRITEPTRGRATLNGRVGSLLEVGTGFHPEFSGRENIYMNGAILGMHKAEIDRKLDEIVEFAEIERFIDTPVKRYSSGMYVRLAFAVAAHLEPEILLVDEVLAVGDAAFQRKSLGKMSEVSNAGRTVLFVSHNMISIRNLCHQVIWLQSGEITHRGPAAAVTETYLMQSLHSGDQIDLIQAINSLPDDPSIKLKMIEISQDGRSSNIVVNGKPIELVIRYIVLQRTSGLRVYFDLLDDTQNILVRSFHDDSAEAIPTMEPGEYVSTAIIPADFLAPMQYILRIRATVFNIRSCTGDGIGIQLTVGASSSINRGYPQDQIRSKLQPKIPWNTTRYA
jgi:lipopolysaccharide transport system ATP-binding protein